MWELITFGFLLTCLLWNPQHRSYFQEKTGFEWILDGSNLFIQGFLIPILRIVLVFNLLEKLWPEGRGLLMISPFWGFILCFIGVDYLYYWNHRLLHHKKLFRIHWVHHTVKKMDVLATSRNTLWTSFLLVYLWINGLLLYITDFNQGLIWGMSLTACLDLWKHSTFLQGHLRLQRWLSHYLLLMTPLDHAWHHASKLNYNFGANLNLFDRLHGTYCAEKQYPEHLGIQSPLRPWQMLIYPFEI